MATTINWGTKTINVLRSDLALIQSVPTEIRQLNLNTFRLDLKNLEDSSDGMAFERTHNHNTSVSVGGVILARVIEIINGYTLTFEDGQYAVNLVGANSNVGDVVNVNQVSVRSANSAGLQDLSTLLASAYQGEVAVDPIYGQSGIDIPIGTRGTPSNNMSDTLTIAENNSIKVIRFLRNMTLSENDYSDGYTFIGDNPVSISVDILDAANVQSCEFKNMSVSGVLDGNNMIRECSIYDLTYTQGILHQCALLGTISVASASQATILDSFSGIAGDGQGASPTVDMNGDGSLALRNYSGTIHITNVTGGGDLTLDMLSGRVIIDASCTTPEDITIRGDCVIEDNSTGVIDLTSTNKIEEIHGQVRRYVFINTEKLVNGDGSQRYPFNNFSDGVDYAEAFGLYELVILADATVDRQLKNFTITGINTPTIDFNNQILTGSEFYRCSLAGHFHTTSGSIVATQCVLLNGNMLNGYYDTCALGGDLVCADGASILLSKCMSLIAGLLRPSVSMNSGGISQLSVRGYSGGIDIRDCDNAGDNCTVELLAGSVSIATTCVLGNVVLRGIGEYQDNSNGVTVTVELVNPRTIWNMSLAKITEGIGDWIIRKLLTTNKFLGLK